MELPLPCGPCEDDLAFGDDAPFSVLPPAQPPASELPEPAAPEPKHCGQCAAVKRLKGASSDGLTAWHARPCVQCASQVTAAQQVQAAGVSSMCMRSALKEDLAPRRLFDFGPSDADDDLSTELMLDGVDAGNSQLVSAGAETTSWEASLRQLSPPLRPPSSLATPISPSPLSVPAEDAAGGSAKASYTLQGDDTAESSGWRATPNSTFEMLADGYGTQPPPLLPSSSFEAAAVARDNPMNVHSPGLHSFDMMQSPGLAFAAARMIVRDGASSSCATPSRTPHAGLRPPTPGAPGSNVRRTTSFIDGVMDDDGDGDESSVNMSLTDSVLMQLTQNFTSISLGSKRTAAERDQS